ncbi:Carboxyl-terminal-processing peptidase 3, chloroplastic, partial [Linum perenne]
METGEIVIKEGRNREIEVIDQAVSYLLSLIGLVGALGMHFTLMLLLRVLSKAFPDWDLKLQQTMVKMFPRSSYDVAYNKISGMLSTVKDPFTQIISPKEYQSFRIGSDGNLQGLGVFINLESKIGHL